MGTLAIILISIAVTILALLVLALLIPRRYSVTVSTVIGKPRDLVFDYVSILRHQLDYSEWYKAGGKFNTVFTGTDGTVGAVMRWDSDNKDLGKGEQEIKMMDDECIDIELRFIKPITGTCKLRNHIVAINDSATRYTCTFHAYAKFPINLPAVLFGKRFIRKAQQRTLNNVKAILESEQKELIS